jgi:hypothetical protein
MPDASILAPVFALAGWTGLVLLSIAFQRLRAGFAGTVSPREYALGESDKVPAQVSLPNRNYMNLLELPVLFYAACIIQFVAQADAPHALALAWLYVALRIVHSLIHVTYNHVMHRFAAFALSNFVLLGLWVELGIGVFGKP